MDKLILFLFLPIFFNTVQSFIIVNGSDIPIRITHGKDYYLTFLKAGGALTLTGHYSEFMVQEAHTNPKDYIRAKKMVIGLENYTIEQLNNTSTIFVIQKNIKDNKLTFVPTVNGETWLYGDALQRAEEIESKFIQAAKKSSIFRKKMLVGSMISVGIVCAFKAMLSTNKAK